MTSAIEAANAIGAADLGDRRPPAAPATGRAIFCSCASRQPVKLSQGVKANFDHATLAGSRAVAPCIAFCDQKGPAIGPRYLTAAIASGAAAVLIRRPRAKKVFRNLRKCVRCCLRRTSRAGLRLRSDQTLPATALA